MSVTGDVETSGIEGTMAHIHRGAVGVSGPIVETLEKNSATRWSVAAKTMLTETQCQTYMAGELHVNVRRVAHESGEIRLHLIPKAIEPGSARPIQGSIIFRLRNFSGVATWPANVRRELWDGARF
jgi:hypothetical protein